MKSTAYSQGRKAYLENRDLFDNPYDFDINYVAYYDWVIGFLDAEDQSQRPATQS